MNTADYVQQARAYAKQVGIDADFFVGLINSESGFNPDAINQRTGAFGLGQFLPSTARDEGIDILNPSDNLRGAAEYFKKRLDQFGGDYDAAAAAYKGAAHWNSATKSYSVDPRDAKKYGDIVRSKYIDSGDSGEPLNVDSVLNRALNAFNKSRDSGGAINTLINFSTIIKQMVDNPILIIFALFGIFLIVFSTMQLVQNQSSKLIGAVIE
jgi:hypothetical protein